MSRLAPIVATFALGLIAVVVVVAVATVLQLPSPPSLTDTTWQWTAATTGPGAAPSTVPDPARYTLEFLDDRTFRATADCTNIGGTFVRVRPGRRGPVATLEIQRVPDTPVSCGGDSLADRFVWGLDRSGHYWILDGQLTITLRDGGTMVFSP